jgi:replicative DNA helicase
MKLPNNLEIEKNCLRAVIHGREDLIPILKKEYFFNQNNKAIFHVINELDLIGEKIDAIILMQEINQRYGEDLKQEFYKLISQDYSGDVQKQSFILIELWMKRELINKLKKLFRM